MAVKTASRQSINKRATDVGGSFWEGQGYSQSQLRALCLRFDHSRVKVADIGGEQESGFEQAFSSLAYAYLKDKAPRLIDFILGFQLVDRNEDNTKAVGIFGFKVGKQWLYAPVFFLNGDLKGHELLYIKNQDSFVPMKENWVNYIMSRKPHVLGEGSPKDNFQLGGLSPNIERLSWPPSHGKFGSDTMGVAVDSWARDFFLPIAACQTKSARFLWRDLPNDGRTFNIEKIAKAPLQAALSGGATLDQFLKEDWRLAKVAHDWSQRFPGIKAGLDKFYGKDFFLKLAAHHKTANDQAKTNIFTATAPARVKAATLAPNSTSILPIAPRVKKAAGDEKVKIVTRDDVMTAVNLPELTEGEKTKALNHGYLVKDEREGEEVTKVYNTQVRQELSNPHEGGLYEVMERPGSFERMLVVTNPYAADGKQNFCTVIRLEGDSKAWLNAHRSTIFAKRIELDEEYKKWFEKLGDKSSLENGGVYVAINHNAQASCPFTVRDSYDDGRYKVDFEAYSVKPRDSYLPRTILDGPSYDGPCSSSGDGYVSNYGAILAINKRKDCHLRAIGGELHVPENDFKFLKLKDPPKPKKDDNNICCAPMPCEPGSEPRPITPGNLADLQLMFTEKTAKLSMLGDAHEVSLFTKAGHARLPYTQALFHLIRDHGTSEVAASEMLKAAMTRGRMKEMVTYRLKYADSYGMDGPSAPPMPAPQYGSEQMGYNSVNSIYPQEENIPVPGMDSHRTDPRIYDPFLRITPDQQAAGVAQQAGQEGQKEVFDTAMISGMLKAVRQDTLVDRYLGDLMKGVDKLGRLLFMFYWHQEEFADRYGKSDLPELEDSLRNAFETLGDVVLFLKEKTIEPGLDESMDPSIEESARN